MANFYRKKESVKVKNGSPEYFQKNKEKK